MDLQLYQTDLGFKKISEDVDLTEGKNTNEIWSNIENETWIYINNDILEWIGIDKKRITKELKEYYKVNKHYREINNLEFKNKYKNDGIISNNRTKHLIINPKTFKILVMSLDTKKGSEIRDYYLDIQIKVFEMQRVKV